MALTPQRMLRTGDTIVDRSTNEEGIIHLVYNLDGKATFGSRVSDIEKVVIFNSCQENKVVNINNVTLPRRK